jgi:hypothetical protein
MRPTGDLPRDFIDRLMRGVLVRPENLGDFVTSARPRLAANFVFELASPVKREFVTEDWRRREADLLFEVPYRRGQGETDVLVWVLLEHQSDTDTMVPLRMLLEAVMAWSGQWQAWQQRPAPRGPLRLRPLVPLVLYTANRPWGSNETLRDLVEAPPELLDLVPQWGPIFWNLSEHPAEELLMAGPLMQLLAVMRVGEEETAVFQDVLRRASANLASLAGPQVVRWQELIHGLLSYTTWRRPEAELAALVSVVQQTNPGKDREVSAMAETMAEHLMQQGATQARLEDRRSAIRAFLQDKFGELPEPVLQRIASCADLERLWAALRQAPYLEKLEDLKL